MDGPFITVKEAGRILGVGPARAYELVRAGHIPVVRMGRRLYVPRRWQEELANAAIERAKTRTAVIRRRRIA